MLTYSSNPSTPGAWFSLALPFVYLLYPQYYTHKAQHSGVSFEAHLAFYVSQYRLLATLQRVSPLQDLANPTKYLLSIDQEMLLQH